MIKGNFMMKTSTSDKFQYHEANLIKCLLKINRALYHQITLMEMSQRKLNMRHVGEKKCPNE